MKRLSFLSSDLVLGLLVALLSILTAMAAYQSTIADAESGDLNVNGQKLLTDSNSYYLEANQFVIYDYTMYDGWILNQDVDDFAAQYFFDSFSEALSASLDRAEGPWDDPYYDEMYQEAEETYADAIVLFEDAKTIGDKADLFQLIGLIFAVGLALAAYGSLLDRENNLRILFSAISVGTLIYGLYLFLTL